MIAELGHMAVILAFVVAFVQAILPMWGGMTGDARLMHTAGPAALVQFGAVGFAFVMLTIAFVTSDFSVKLVASNSHSLKPMLYKFSGVWGNHEGSMLLWILILVFYGALVAVFGRGLPLLLKARVLSVQSMISLAFLAFLLFTSNPFERLELPPVDGNDLNPLLQDPGLAFHPPFLYFGYVGLSMTFSFAVAALLQGSVDAAWARWVRPWALLAWVTLTIGIALGSWWAYYELGWGGWWFWDPVENASFMPWLIAVALLHSAIVVEKRESLKTWTVLLAILGFSFSLIGTFIVRSGVITSVHAFANDPERGVFILAILVVAIGGSLTLFALRAASLKSTAVFSMVSRESGLVVNNLLLVVAAIVVFVGTIWPLVAELTTGRKLSVGAPFFNLAFTPFMVGIALVLPVAALLPWKRGKLAKTARPLWGAAVLAVALMLLIWSLQTGGRMLAPIGLGLAAWVVLGAVFDVAQRGQIGRIDLGASLRRLRNLPRADWGKAVAHAGLGLTIFGISAITAWEVEDIRVAQIGERFTLSGYEFSFDKVEDSNGKNYSATIGTVSVRVDERIVAVLHPEKRFYPVQRMPTTEAGISSALHRDLYVALGDQQGDGWVLRSYVKPFAVWIWIGSIVMALGGGLSLSDRRFRVGAAKRRAGRREVAA
ncbi:c-type cytochrome biogenesis protein CcmF [Amylibacter marinus]|uniref:C-type cytochrome biogenesis protein CcmF n=1 Tax=Amylibacter marinus TaxID=1475483 RepID=A0ABQ5VT88_9RHOB|nr:heme lyase CcmF/NrfE family subunit [Amylibacter marinus]GLQ34394.1 c-type cytochrome biogenesis protein CcmF [Amylibacter marinus]